MATGGLGLAMGGGGITGCCHVGVIQALEEEGIPISAVAGTSSGAIVAALYAGGRRSGELAKLVPAITKRVLDYDFQGLLGRFILGKPCIGMVRGRRLRAFLQKHLGEDGLKDMQLPVSITATDLQSGRQVLFASGPLMPLYASPGMEVVRDASLLDAVMASMSIPGLFHPVRMGERLLVDGGLSDNCPSAPLKAMGAGPVLAVNLVSVQPVRKPIRHMSTVVTRSLSIGLNRLSESDSGYADIVLKPDVGLVGLLDFGSSAKCMELGYECARSRMEDIKRLAEAALVLS